MTSFRRTDDVVVSVEVDEHGEHMRDVEEIEARAGDQVWCPGCGKDAEKRELTTVETMKESTDDT